MRADRAGWPVLVALAWTVLLFLMLPTLVAIPVSLTPERYLSLPKGGISFEHYAEFFGDPSWRGALGQSLAIGLAVTLLATGIGTLAAVALWRLSSWLAEGVRAPGAGAHDRAADRLGAGLLPGLGGPGPARHLHRRHRRPHAARLALRADHGLGRARHGRPPAGAGVALARRLLVADHPLGDPAADHAGRRDRGGVRLHRLVGRDRGRRSSSPSRAVYTLPRKMWDGINEQVDPTIAAAATVLFLVTLVAIGWQIARQARRSALAAARGGSLRGGHGRT